MIVTPTPKTYTWRFARPFGLEGPFLKNVLSFWIGQNKNQNEVGTRSEQPYRRGGAVYGIIWHFMV